MQNSKKCDTLSVKDGWLICPACGRGKVLKLGPCTSARNLIVYCKRCGKESTVNIDERLCQSRAATSA